MGKFVRLLLSSWLSRVLFLSGLASLVAGFLGVGVPNWVTVTIFLGAYLYASYDVFQKQEREIRTFKQKLAQQEGESERPELVIHPKLSRFIPSVITDRQNKKKGTQAHSWSSIYPLRIREIGTLILAVLICG
jgi:hypothetical protein